METCRICNLEFAYLEKVSQNFLVCESCSLKVIQQHFSNTQILYNPLVRENYICVECFNKAEIIHLVEGYPETYCFECSRDFKSSEMIQLRSINLKKYQKQRISSEKLKFLQEKLKNFDFLTEEVKKDVDDYKKKLNREYESASSQLHEEYLKSMKTIELFEKKAEILIKNLANQAKLAVFKKSYEDRTEGEDILFSKSNFEYCKSQLKLKLSFDSQETSNRIAKFFKIEEIDFFTVFPCKLHSFVEASSIVLDFTPNLLTKRLRSFPETVKWNKGAWIEITEGQIIKNNVQVEGTAGLALISNYNQVKLIEKISYANEAGFLAHQDLQLFYLGSELAFKINQITLEKTQQSRTPYLVKEGSSATFDSKIILASQNQPGFLLFDAKKNEYLKKKCEPLKLSKKFLFKFEGKLLILYENFLYEILEVLGTSKLLVLSETLPERFYQIASCKIVEKHVYLLTNYRVVYRLSMISKSLEIIKLE